VVWRIWHIEEDFSIRVRGRNVPIAIGNPIIQIEIRRAIISAVVRITTDKGCRTINPYFIKSLKTYLFLQGLQEGEAERFQLRPETPIFREKHDGPALAPELEEPPTRAYPVPVAK
jgi:hypothetical protein